MDHFSGAWVFSSLAACSDLLGRVRDVRSTRSWPIRAATRPQVKLSGSVVDSYSVMGNGAYQLEDKTGRLWIVSNGVPRKGARVSVKGTVREGFSLGSVGDGSSCRQPSARASS